MSASRGQGAPVALLWALALLGLLEVGLRQVDMSRQLPVVGRPHWYRRALAVHIQDDPPCDVCVVGSSRVQDGIVTAQLAAGVPAGRVANYGMPGAGTEGTYAAVRAILRHHRPRVILYGVSVHPLVVGPANNGVAEYLAAAAGHWQGWPSPLAWQAIFDRHVLAFRYRERPVALAYDLMAWAKDPSWSRLRLLAKPGAVAGYTDTFAGEAAFRHHQQPGRTVLADPPTVAEVQSYMDRFVGAAPFAPQPARLAELRALADLCREAGVELVFFEVPLSRWLADAFGQPAQAKFRAAVRALAQAGGARFLDGPALGGAFTDADFSDPSHLHPRGARRLTAALLQKLWPDGQARHFGETTSR